MNQDEIKARIFAIELMIDNHNDMLRVIYTSMQKTMIALELTMQEHEDHINKYADMAGMPQMKSTKRTDPEILKAMKNGE